MRNITWTKLYLYSGVALILGGILILIGFVFPRVADAAVPTSVGVNSIQRTAIDTFNNPAGNWAYYSGGATSTPPGGGGDSNNATWNGDILYDANDYPYIVICDEMRSDEYFEVSGTRCETAASAAQFSFLTDHIEFGGLVTSYNPNYRIPTVLPTQADGMQLWLITDKEIGFGSDITWVDSLGADQQINNQATTTDNVSIGGEDYYLSVFRGLEDVNDEGFLESLTSLTGDSQIRVYATIYTAGDLSVIETANDFQEYLDLIFSVSQQGETTQTSVSTIPSGVALKYPTPYAVTSSTTVQFHVNYFYIEPDPGEVAISVYDTYDNQLDFYSALSGVSFDVDTKAYYATTTLEIGHRYYWTASINDFDGNPVKVSSRVYFDVIVPSIESGGGTDGFTWELFDAATATSSQQGIVSGFFLGIAGKIAERHPFAWFIELTQLLQDLRDGAEIDEALIEYDFAEIGLSTSTQSFLDDSNIDLVAFSSSTVTALIPSGVLSAFRILIAAGLWIGFAFTAFTRIKTIV